MGGVTLGPFAAFRPNLEVVPLRLKILCARLILVKEKAVGYSEVTELRQSQTKKSTTATVSPLALCKRLWDTQRDGGR